MFNGTTRAHLAYIFTLLLRFSLFTSLSPRFSFQGTDFIRLAC